MTDKQIAKYEKLGWKFKPAKFVDPQSGMRTPLDMVISPRIEFYADVKEDSETELIKEENRSYADKLKERSNYWDLEDKLEKLLKSNPKARKAVFSVKLV